MSLPLLCTSHQKCLFKKKRIYYKYFLVLLCTIPQKLLLWGQGKNINYNYHCISQPIHIPMNKIKSVPILFSSEYSSMSHHISQM